MVRPLPEWSCRLRGGTLSSATATTDANGRAATRLTLGSKSGINTVSATVAGLESVTFTATGQEDPFVSLFGSFGGGKLVALPDSPQLAQNAPNPFNSQTVLSYFLPAPSPAHLAVFTLTGQRGRKMIGHIHLHGPAGLLDLAGHAWMWAAWAMPVVAYWTYRLIGWLKKRRKERSTTAS